MDIVEEAIRSVAQGDVIPHEIGTVGPIYAEEYEKLKSEGYALDDSVGKSGIERAMESTLRGTDGIKKITVENGVVVSSDMETPGGGWQDGSADCQQRLSAGTAKHSGSWLYQ